MKNIVISLIVLLLSACASTPNIKPAPVSESSKPTITQPASKSNSTSNTMNSADIEAKRLAAEKLAAEKLAAEIRDLQKQSVYFDFDQFSVKPEFKDLIQHQAAFVKAHSKDIVTVEGNTDERGSDEYNLALGDRRANAVKKDLELMGVIDAQIKTVSYGEEKPRLTCHEEKCWMENRRDDFVHSLN